MRPLISMSFGLSAHDTVAFCALADPQSEHTHREKVKSSPAYAIVHGGGKQTPPSSLSVATAQSILATCVIMAGEQPPNPRTSSPLFSLVQVCFPLLASHQTKS